MRKQSGFTLIELITVIVILGILSAFALPRFAGLESQARAASISGLEGSLRAAAALAHSLQLANGVSAGGSVTMEGQVITLVNGYPAEPDVVNTLVDLGTAYVENPVGSGNFEAAGANVPANCRVDYDPPAGLNLPPIITVDITAC